MRKMILAAVLAAAPTVALAQPAPAQPVDAARLAAARELLDVSDIRRDLSTNMEKAVAQYLNMQLRSGPADKQLPAELTTELTKIAQEELRAYMSNGFPRIIEENTKIYARRFTTEELKHLTQLQRDPVMAKFRSQMGEIMGEMMPVMMDLQKPLRERLASRMDAAIKDYQARHPAKKP